MKKLTSIFMAVAMILALAIPVMAEGEQTPPDTSGNLTQNSSFAGEYQATRIKITMPTTLGLVLNPYRLNYSGNADVRVAELANQIFSAPVTVKSESNIGLKVDMTVTPTFGSNLTPVATKAAAEAEAEDKNVYLAMEYGLVTEANGDPSATATKKHLPLDEAKVINELENADNWFVTIPAGDTTPQYFGINFTGAANTDTVAPYDTDDKIDVAIAFTFIPVANDDIQVQGGTFTYNAFAADGTTAVTDIANVGSDADDIEVEVPVAQQKEAVTTDWTLSDVKVNGATIASDNIATTLAFDNDGKTLTLKKATVWGAREADATKVTVGTKYVKVIPVEFTATSGSGDSAKTANINCNVRVIYDPAKASS